MVPTIYYPWRLQRSQQEIKLPSLINRPTFKPQPRRFQVDLLRSNTFWMNTSKLLLLAIEFPQIGRGWGTRNAVYHTGIWERLLAERKVTGGFYLGVVKVCGSGAKIAHFPHHFKWIWEPWTDLPVSHNVFEFMGPSCITSRIEVSWDFSYHWMEQATIKEIPNILECSLK